MLDKIVGFVMRELGIKKEVVVTIPGNLKQSHLRRFRYNSDVWFVDFSDN